MSGTPRAASHEFLRFVIVGAAGFVVDAGALMFATSALGLGLYSGRVFSYLCAATFTWICNRRFTFAGTAQPAIVQWLRFLGANAIGGAVNYGVYAAVVTLSVLGARFPVLGVAAGSAAGLLFNFAVSKYWVFRRAD
ncbi:MAG: GtrA family protein [Proteobacteria bacterium]|nr:GtrA family protein [Pseudomonadota bacterium]